MQTSKAFAPGFVVLALVSTSFASQVPPTYSVEVLTSTTASVADLDAHGRVIGTTPLGLVAERAWVAGPGDPLQFLPLPPGRQSSRAEDINDLGEIVGSVGSSTYADPTFGAIAAHWTPNGAGGYTVRELGRLPGDIGSIANALNNIGDIVGSSQGGMYRRAVLFTHPTGVQDLTPTGAFDPRAINDLRIVVCYASHCSRLDLNTMVLQDLGVPPGSYTNTLGIAINESNQVGGLAIVATSTSCDRVAARYTDGIGWETFGSCGSSNGVGSLNNHGDFTRWANTSSVVRLEGIGSFALEPQIVEPLGSWYLGVLATGRINDSRQIAIFGQNIGTGQSGILLLTPLTYVGEAFCAGDGIAAPCPCSNTSTLGTYEGCRNSTGRGARLLATGTASIAADDLVLHVSQAAPLSVALLVQGALDAPRSVYDGLLCIGAPARRLELLTLDGAGTALSTTSVVGAGAVQAGETRVYQVWYRDVGGPCGTNANVTPALRITWH